MIKKIFLLFLLFILSIYAYADSNYLGNKFWHTDEYVSVCISEDKIELDDRVEKGRLYHKNGFDVFAGASNKYIVLETKLPILLGLPIPDRCKPDIKINLL
jgi:hypothetical protein